MALMVGTFSALLLTGILLIVCCCVCPIIAYDKYKNWSNAREVQRRASALMNSLLEIDFNPVVHRE